LCNFVRKTIAKTIVQSFGSVNDKLAFVLQVLKQVVGMSCQAGQQSTNTNQRVTGRYFDRIVPPRPGAGPR